VGLVGLSRLYEDGGLVADSDGDGILDTVTARVFIDRRGTVADFVAAVNFSARLGYAVVSYAPGIAVIADGDDRAGRAGGDSGTTTAVCFGLPSDSLRVLARELLGREIEAGQGLVAIADGELVVGGIDDDGRRLAGLFLTQDWPSFGPPDLDARGLTAILLGPEEGRVAAFRLKPMGRTTGAGETAASETAASETVGGEAAMRGPAAVGEGQRPASEAAIRRPGSNGRLNRRLDLAEPFAAGNLVSGPSAADGAPGGERPRCVLWLRDGSTAGEAVAACEVAYRLGVEASEMDWPLAFGGALEGGPAPSAEWVIRFETRASPPAEIVVDDRGLIIRGDEMGLTAAARALALSFRGSGEEGVPTGQSGLSAVGRSLGDFLGLRSPAGQVAGVTAVMDRFRRPGRDGPDVRAVIRLDDPGPSAEAFLRTRFGGSVGVAPLSVTTVIGHYQAAWEVETLRSVWAEALTALEREKGEGLAAGEIAVSAGVGEPAEIRRSLAEGFARDLAARDLASVDLVAGGPASGGPASGGPAGEGVRVEVLSAYKPGLSWLMEVIVPALRRLALGPEARVVIGFAPCVQPEGSPRWLEFPIRWLQELYPVDELIARELGLSIERVTFERLEPSASSTYTVTVYGGGEDRSGPAPVFTASFTPPVGERPYLDAFPDEGLVHPTTGWLRVTMAGRVIFERRVETDLERVWGFLQRDFLTAVTTEIKGVGTQPFFERMELEVWASEADEPLGLREERLSPLEALHEDTYFVILDHFAALGRSLTGEPFRAPGPVLPFIHQRLGAGPEVRARLIRRVRPGPMVALTADGRRGGQGGEEVQVDPVTPATLAIERVEVDGSGRPSRVVFSCVFEAPGDVPTAAARLTLIGDLRAAGIPGADLALPPGCALECQLTAPGAEPMTVAIDGPGPRSGEAEPGPSSPLGSDPVVPYDRVLTLSEGRVILDRLASFPAARVWPAGRSFQGRPSYVLEVVQAGAGPAGGVAGTEVRPTVISRNKLRLLRPTLVIVARHHANEVSSSNAALRLAEDLLRSPGWAELRRQVNLVVIPFENVDGVALHERMEKEHPTWKLHAARFNAAGQDVAVAYADPGTPFGESRVLPLVWDLWRPDVISDEHGVPSHEWDQPFSGYVCRSYASFWLPRAFFYAYLSYLDDPAYPGRRAFSEAIRRRIADALAGDEEIRAWNRIWRERYERFGYAWMPKEFPAPPDDYFRDLLVYFNAVKRDDKGGFQRRLPGSILVSWVSEVNDETAQGDYLALCARAHYLADEAVLRLLADGPWEVVRETTTVETPAGRAVRRFIRRPRPPRH